MNRRVPSPHPPQPEQWERLLVDLMLEGHELAESADGRITSHKPLSEIRRELLDCYREEILPHVREHGRRLGLVVLAEAKALGGLWR